MNLGTIVTYDDEDPDDTIYVGAVVTPTDQELSDSLDSDEIGPAFGDVMVEWRHEGEVYKRAWESPNYLIAIERKSQVA
jgi:hypothetical protein